MNGIKKLFGSFPLLNKNIELIKRKMNIIVNNNIVLKEIIPIIMKGLTILTPEIIPIMYPIMIKAIKLNIIVKNKPKKSSFNRLEYLILGSNVPI